MSEPFTRLTGSGIYSSIFSTANIGCPAVIWPTKGILTISWFKPDTLLSDDKPKTSIALGLVGSLLI